MNCLRIFRNRKHHGFSLIEVTLALGLLIFALVAIVGLLPIAMKSSLEGEREAEATFIAQNIFSDLASGYSPAVTFVTTGEDVLEPGGRRIVNLANPAVVYVVYNKFGRPLFSNALGSYDSSMATPDVAYGARIVIRPNPSPSNLSKVEVEVEAPLSAPAARRTKYNFTTELRNR